MAGLLTNADVARLLHDPSADARLELADKLGHELTNEQLAPQELTIAQDIVRMLARDVEVAVRAMLAHNVRNARHPPRDVALRMAQDVETVALPILSESLVLTDGDLVELVRGGSSAKQRVIAGRPALSETVSGALIDHADEQAVAVLMGNPTALVSEDSLERAVERFRDSDVVKTSMVHRPTLPMTVAERLAVIVSRSLQHHLVQNHALPASVASDLVMQGREDAILRLSAGADEPELLRMVAQMHNSRRLTPSIVVRALCTGDIAFFEAAMATMTHVPIENVRALVHDQGENGLASLYKAADMPPGLYPMVRAAIDTMAETGFDGEARDLERFRTRVISRVLTQNESADGNDMDYLVDKLRDLLLAA